MVDLFYACTNTLNAYLIPTTATAVLVAILQQSSSGLHVLHSCDVVHDNMTNTFEASRTSMQMCALFWCFSLPVSYWRHLCNFATYRWGRVYSSLPANWILRQCRGIMKRKCWVTLQNETPSDKLPFSRGLPSMMTSRPSLQTAGVAHSHAHCCLKIRSVHLQVCLCSQPFSKHTADNQGVSLQWKLCSVTIRAKPFPFWKRKMPLRLEGCWTLLVKYKHSWVMQLTHRINGPVHGCNGCMLVSPDASHGQHLVCWTCPFLQHHHSHFFKTWSLYEIWRMWNSHWSCTELLRF